MIFAFSDPPSPCPPEKVRIISVPFHTRGRPQMDLYIICLKSMMPWEREKLEECYRFFSPYLYLWASLTTNEYEFGEQDLRYSIEYSSRFMSYLERDTVASFLKDQHLKETSKNFDLNHGYGDIKYVIVTALPKIQKNSSIFPGTKTFEISWGKFLSNRIFPLLHHLPLRSLKSRNLDEIISGKKICPSYFRVDI